MVSILFYSYKPIISYDRAKLKKVGDFYVLTWLIFTGPVTFNCLSVMLSEIFGLSAISMLVTSEISLGNSNTKYDPPEKDGSVISISIHKNYIFAGSYVYPIHSYLLYNFDLRILMSTDRN